MTVKQIEQKQTRDAVKFEIAKQIRQILDEAKKKYGADEWDGDDMDNEISQMVFEDE